MLDGRSLRDPSRRSRLAWALTLYAVIGLVILAIVAAGLIGATLRARDTLAALEVQRDGVVRLLDSTGRALESADDSSDRLTSTLEGASDSITRAAGLSRAVAIAAQGVVNASGLELFGQRPLAALGDPFGVAATEAEGLAASLDATGSSLVDSSTDVARLSADLEAIGDELDEIRETLAEVDLEAGSILDMALGAALLLLLWLAAPALGALWLARVLRRTTLASAAPDDEAPRR